MWEKRTEETLYLNLESLQYLNVGRSVQKEKKKQNRKNCDALGAKQRMCVKKGELINTAECFKRSSQVELKLCI